MAKNRKFSLFSVKLLLFLRCGSWRNMKNANYLAFKKGQEAAETIISDAYFISHKSEKIWPKIENFHFFTKFSTILLRYGYWPTTTIRRKINIGNAMKNYPSKSFELNFSNKKALQNWLIFENSFFFKKFSHFFEI